MTSKERVLAALRYQPVDKVPLEYHPCTRGFYEHGEAFRRILKQYPGDFEDFSDSPLPQVSPALFDAEGKFHEIRTDEWNVTSESYLYAMLGHPVSQPLEDISRLDEYEFPPHRLADPLEFQRYQAHLTEVKKTAFAKTGFVGFFEKMHWLRPFEEVLMDVYEDTDEINLLADRLVEYQIREIRDMLDAGADAIQFGDDFGTSNNLMFSRETWIHFFRPRYQKMIDVVKEYGKPVFFHSCGYVWDLLDQFAELGVNAVWPQLNVYEPDRLHGYLKELGMACALHIARYEQMRLGTPEDVREIAGKVIRSFDVMNGGAYFYMETDDGTPLQNIEALMREFDLYR